MSPGFVIRRAECSICHQDPATCPHITGRVYEDVRAVRIITEADLLEISVVDHPQQPDARIDGLSLPVKDMQRRLGPDWRPGMPVSCDRCIKPCTGLVTGKQLFGDRVSAAHKRDRLTDRGGRIR